MQLGSTRVFTSGVALAAGLLLAAGAVEAADPVADETTDTMAVETADTVAVETTESVADETADPAADESADPVVAETEGAEPVAEEQTQVPSLPSVLVHRGSVTETVSFAATAEADSQEVVVSRGTTEPDAPTVQAPAPAPEARIWSSSGRDLWFYDPEDESLRACRLFKGQYVGRWKIRCFERRL